jgi:hypothetical protein
MNKELETTSEDLESAFMSGMSNVTGESYETDSDDADVEQEVIEEPEVVEPNPLDELRTRFDAYQEHLDRIKDLDPNAVYKRLDQAFGKLGQLDSDLKTFKPQPVEVTITPDMLESINEQFGDDLSVSFANDLSKILNKLQLVREVQSQSITPDDLTALVAEKLQAEREVLKSDFAKEQFEREHKRLLRRHKDAHEISDSQEFKDWVNSEPEVLEILLDPVLANDASEISDVLDKFKQLKAAKAKEQQTKQEKLNRAVVPKTSAPANNTKTLSTSDAFNLGLTSKLKELGR